MFESTVEAPMELGIIASLAFPLGAKDLVWMCSSIGVRSIQLDIETVLSWSARDRRELFELAQQLNIRVSGRTDPTRLVRLAKDIRSIVEPLRLFVGEEAALLEEGEHVGGTQPDIWQQIVALPVDIVLSEDLYSQFVAQYPSAARDANPTNICGYFAGCTLQWNVLDDLVQLATVKDGSLAALELDPVHRLPLPTELLAPLDEIVRFIIDEEIPLFLVAPSPDHIIDWADLLHRRERSLWRGQLTLEEFT